MTDIDPPAAPEPGEPPTQQVHDSRLRLIWDVTLFQFKLVADGVLDLLMSPLSIAAGILGLMAGGDDPHQYLRRVLRLGRRTDVWINLFGLHRRRGTSDEMVDSLRERVFTEATTNPWLSRAGSRLNERLDSVNARRSREARAESESASEQ
jgi:hypothetical protein